jgi:tetraacyldisaccharide 4'-kinase
VQQKFLLQLVHPFYAAGVKIRLALYRANIFKTYKLNTPVISVGNISFGGTGKTPCAAFIANYLHSEGWKVAILSRGYKRESEGIIEVSNGQKILCAPNISGDEPYLLAEQCPGVRVIVDADRYSAGLLMENSADIDVFVLDDGYQHIKLHRDLNILLIDATTDLNVRSNFREPLQAMDRADAVIITRSSQLDNRELFRRRLEKYCQPQAPIFFADHDITGFRSLFEIGRNISNSSLKSLTVVTLSGIGNPERFAYDLQKLGLKILKNFTFSDHHRYTQSSLEFVMQQAKYLGAEAIISTEKDAVNISPEVMPEQKLPIYIAQLDFKCEDSEKLKQLLMSVRNAP